MLLGLFLVRFLSVQCYAWTEYKLTCVCLCVRHTFCQLPYRSNPQRVFTADSLKDADLRKDMPFGVSMMNNHI